MKYLLLIYHAENALANNTKSDMEALYSHHLAMQEKSRAAGAFVGASRLEMPDTATTLRQENGQFITTDGPFAETREVLVGYYLLECANLDEAMAYAKMLPYFETAAVEIRPVGFCVDP
jgi:hypothetical protein